MPAAILERLKKWMQGENSVRLIVLAGLAGLVCILLSSFFPEEKEDPAGTGAEPVQTAEPVQSAERYAQGLEARLEEILMQIEGVGKCRVMITVSGSESYSYAQDTQQHAQEDSQELQREHVIIDEGEGDAALVEHIANPEVIGVIIACEGGQNHVVREQIYEAASAVLDVPSNRICVTQRINESEESS
ncbi:MAG: hypothetical protein IJ496_10110 [Ruminococcus sp.]|nr:hypothetical protein [Ruminococcus sp.]